MQISIRISFTFLIIILLNHCTWFVGNALNTSTFFYYLTITYYSFTCTADALSTLEPAALSSVWFLSQLVGSFHVNIDHSSAMAALLSSSVGRISLHNIAVNLYVLIFPCAVCCTSSWLVAIWHQLVAFFHFLFSK